MKVSFLWDAQVWQKSHLLSQQRLIDSSCTVTANSLTKPPNTSPQDLQVHSGSAQTDRRAVGLRSNLIHNSTFCPILQQTSNFNSHFFISGFIGFNLLLSKGLKWSETSTDPWSSVCIISNTEQNEMSAKVNISFLEFNQHFNLFWHFMDKEKVTD